MGPIGLFRTISAERGFYGPWAFTMGITAGYFNQEDFPVSGQDTKKMWGRASLSYTPLAPFEVFVAGSAFTNNGGSNTDLRQQVGNVEYGLKTAYDIKPEIAVGTVFLGHFQKSAADLNFQSHAYTYDLLGVATLDLLRNKKFPLRAHANFGYRWDGTKHLMDATASEGARMVYGVLGYNALLGAVGFEVPVRNVVFSTEYSTEQTFGTPNAGYFDKPQRVTLGARYFPTRNEAFALELASDINFFAARGTNRVIREPDWQIMTGLTYAFGAYRRVIESKPQPAALVAQPTVLVGTVTAAKTNQPVGGAEIELCEGRVSPLVTDSETGQYRSYALPTGNCKVTVAANGYQTHSETVKLAEQKEVRQNFVLERAEPSKGAVLLQVRDSTNVGVKATVSLPDLPQVTPMETDDAGRLMLRLPVGVYRIVADRGDERGEAPSVEVIEEQEAPLEIQIVPVDVKLEAKSITLKQAVSFVSGGDALTEESKKILNHVASLLKHHPEVHHVEIEGHTDSSGPAELNLELSQRRAQAVESYLVAQGVEKAKLTAIGYGSTRPIESNKTQEGRLANRRVEFKIHAK